MLGLPNIWASKWEICFMQMSTVKKTNECNHQCLWWDHHVCSLCSRGWVNYLENMSVLWMPSLEVLAHIRITTGCLFTEIWLKSAVVAALDAKWITSYSSATLLPDSRRLPAGNIGQIEKLMPCATLPWIYMVQQRGNNVFFLRSKYLILVWLKYSPNAQLVLNDKRCPVIKKIYNPHKGTLAVESANARSPQDVLQITKRPWLIRKSPQLYIKWHCPVCAEAKTDQQLRHSCSWVWYLIFNRFSKIIFFPNTIMTKCPVCSEAKTANMWCRWKQEVQPAIYFDLWPVYSSPHGHNHSQRSTALQTILGLFRSIISSQALFFCQSPGIFCCIVSWIPGRKILGWLNAQHHGQWIAFWVATDGKLEET